MSTVTNTQVAVKYRRNVGSLSIDMSADNRTTTLGRHIDRHIGRVSVDISTDARPTCRPIYRATHLCRHIDRHSTDMSTDISVDTRTICRPIHRSRGAQNAHDLRKVLPMKTTRARACTRARAEFAIWSVQKKRLFSVKNVLLSPAML